MSSKLIMSDKIKIINILDQPPAYEEWGHKPRPALNWNTPDGSWVGIWGYDWPDQIGEQVLKQSDEFIYEVWQIDPRADKIYTAVLPSGVIHKLFPASKKYYFNGFKVGTDYFSDTLIHQIRRLTNSSIIHLNGGLDINLNRKILQLNKKKIILQFHGKIYIPVIELARINKNFLNVFRKIKLHFLYNKYGKIPKYILYNNN